MNDKGWSRAICVYQFCLLVLKGGTKNERNLDKKRPWVVGDALAIRKVMQATLAGDHRATDGRTGAIFLDKLNQFLQKPEEL